MTFTAKQKSEILALCETHPVIKLLWEDYLVPNPTRKFYNERAAMVDHLSNEMSFLRKGDTGKLKILNSDEKLFERVHLLILNGDKYEASLQHYLEEIDPELKKKDDGKKKKAEPIAIP